MEGKKKKEFLVFLPFLKVCDQLQTSGISKQFDAQKRDWAQIVDYLTQFKMLMNFVQLSQQEVKLCLFEGVSKLISQIVIAKDIL